MIKRRELLRKSLWLGAAVYACDKASAQSSAQPKGSQLIIDAHCHAGKGAEMSAPWTTYADPEVTLRRAA